MEGELPRRRKHEGNLNDRSEQGQGEKVRGQGRLSLRPAPEPLHDVLWPGFDGLGAQVAFQVVAKSSRGGIAILRRLLKALQANQLELSRGIAIQSAWRSGFAFEDLHKRIEWRVSPEGRATGQHF